MADAWFESGEHFRSVEAAGEVFEVYYHKSTMQTEVRARLGEETFAKAWAEGRKMTFDEVLAIPHPPAPGSLRATGSPSQTEAGPASTLPEPADRGEPAAQSEPLTARELDVLHLLAQGLSNPEIAGQLVISRRTVDAHLRAIYEKLGVSSRDAAIRAAQELGLIGKKILSKNRQPR
jgi:DNA-binding CsgD family transcriptional regulator